MTTTPTSRRFSHEDADRTVAFFERILRHTKGQYARKPFILRPWQRDDIIRPLFGEQVYDPQYETWVRRYRIAWLELGRGNGKSEIMAGLALKLLVADDEEGAEVYGAAADREQAGLVYRVAKRMVELSPLLSRRLRVVDSRKRIVDPKYDSFYQVIAADAAGNLGENPHGIIFDEVLAQPNRDLWDALRTGMGKRRQPLMIAATTAGNDPNSFAASEHAYCEKIAEEPERDPSRFVYMRNAPKDADPWDEQTWYTANPALGDFLSLEQLRAEAREAKMNPRAETAFRQFRLNQWVGAASRWLSLEVWDATAGSVDLEALAGARCYGGLDLASSTDVAALCWNFPQEDGTHKALWRYWIPEDTLPDLDRRTAGRARAWVRRGILQATPGNVIDYRAIQEQIERDAARYRVESIAYDRWGMTQLAQILDDAGLEVVPFGQGFASMSPPTKEWERLILEGRYHHGGNDMTRWMISNVVMRTDPAGNVKIDKQRSAEKVDGAVAAVMALDGALRAKPAKRRRFASF